MTKDTANLLGLTLNETRLHCSRQVSRELLLRGEFRAIIRKPGGSRIAYLGLPFLNMKGLFTPRSLPCHELLQDFPAIISAFYVTLAQEGESIHSWNIWG